MIDSITVHVPTLIGLRLSANQYMHLAFLYHNLPVKLVTMNQQELDNLLENDYLCRGFTGLELTDKGRSLFETSNNFIETAFKELYDLYPRQVPDGRGGYRVLRAKGLDSEDAKICKRKYEGIIRPDKKLHVKVMKGLRNELLMRRNSMTYMQNMQTWLNQKGWEKYMDLDIETRDDERVSSI